MPLRIHSTLFGAGLLLALTVPAWAGPETTQADEKTLKDASLSVEGPALLDFFRKRTLGDTDRVQILGLIDKMGDDSFKTREKAFADLLALGPAAAPLLRQAQQTSSDIEVVRRSERCLQLIEKTYSAAIAAAAARVLAIRKPEGTVETLLAYLPFADEEAVVEEVRATLIAAGVRGGQVDKGLVNAVQDKLAIRRAIAGEVLVRVGTAEQRTAMHKLLKDADPSVRLRVGLALVERKDKEALPTLIALLTEAPRGQCWRIEDVLYRLAGEQAPNQSLGTTDDSRRKCRDAWSAWFAKEGAKLDLAKLDEMPRLLGMTLLVELTQGVNGRVRELGKDGKARWSVENLQYPIDATVAGPDRVVIVEYTPRRVSERDLKGNIIWQKVFPAASYPLGAQRLSNGNTVIATRNQIVELDRAGAKEVFTFSRPAGDIMAAAKGRDGHYIFATRTGQCVRVDGNGKEVKSFAIGPVTNMGSNIEVLPNGNILIPQTNNSKVVEYNPEGKAIWEVAAVNPTSVNRLPNGHTLIGSMANQQMVEVDRSGKEITASRAEGRLMRVRMR